MVDFNPMPKRFMVWDKEDDAWLFNGKIFTIQDLVNEFGRVPLIFETCEVVQSTNLFDKDGKEIFEGSIVEDEFNETLGYVYYESKVCAWRIKFNDSEEDDGWTLENSTNVLKNIGHVLSNPELLEEKNV